MSINAYCGLVGSGKSYEVTSSVILPAIAAGRSVVTNIDGINQDLIHDYLCQQNPKLNRDDLGNVIHVKSSDIENSGFFPDEKGTYDSIVKPGDLVAIDEAWRFWKGTKTSFEHDHFFTMHRHFVHPETKVSCDLVVIVQHLSQLNRNLKGLIECTFKMTKLTSLGLNKTYRVDMFEGASTSQSNFQDQFIRKYNKDIFPLYHSFKEGEQGVLKSIDKRQNILKNPKLIVYGVLILIIASISLYYLTRLFSTKPKSAEVAAPTTGAAPVSPLPPPPTQGNFRFAGEVLIHGERFALISDQNQRIRFESADSFTNKGMLAVGTVEGSKTTSYTGILYANKSTSLDKSIGFQK